MLSGTDEHFIGEALKEALKAFDKNEVPVGAVVVCSKRVIARAHNLCETLRDATAHAEMQVMTAAFEGVGGKYLNECILYVTLEPCVMCAGAAFWAQLGKIVYGASDEKRGFARLTTNILHPRTTVVKGIREAECAQLLKDFFEKKRDS